MASLSQKKLYIKPKAKDSQTQTQIRNPSIHLTCEHPIIHLKAININVVASKSYKKEGINFVHISKED